MAGARVKEIAGFLKAIISGNAEKSVVEIAKLMPGKSGALSFCKYEDTAAIGMIWRSASSVIICSEKLKVEPLPVTKTLIYVSKPRLAFSKVANKFFATIRYFATGIHETATVCLLARIAKTASIGPHCVISGTVEIGENSVICGNVSIYGNVKIGKNVIINSGAVIGAEGFGYEPDEDGTLVQFPQIGGVIIEDNVEIGANTCVDRGALGDTIIREGAKIDNLVHVAHNVIIGKNCRVICLVGIGGSVEIGDGSFVGISASIKNQKKIGKNVIVGMGAVVTKDIPDNTTVIGNPARPM
ncbi:MAG: UDP-3-O-(3-hydroxymyristoyl)glucosamine N-acyltransferase [bacterium]|nr:UDP-3-O-(3-hydroxymyristoyl)glucosamine N-acyltransferase [bacterium]